MRILVTGAAGQLGVGLLRELSAHDVVGAARGDLDVTDRDAVHATIDQVAPEAIVHAGAWTAVDDCEHDPDRAVLVNTVGTRHVAEAASRVGARVVYVSTDYVFDGTKPAPYDEWDEPAPASVYGRSKLGGERELGPGSTVVRTSWVCSDRGHNMVLTALRLAEAGGEVAFVDDQRGCPTFADDLAAMIARLVVERRAGTYHVTNQGPTTWFGFVRDVFSLAGHDAERVRPIRTADLDPPRAAPRPANSVLDNRALRLQGVPLLPDHHEPLERTVKELLDR